MVYLILKGCYAKCLGLDPKKEFEIYNAIKKGAILENVVLNADNSVNYNDSSITYNTRCAYPLTHLDNVLIPAIIDSHPKNIVLLVCDAFGIMPLVSKLSHKKAIYYFLLGYTCKMPGTEKDINVPTKTFSTCFAEPFIIWKPEIYGNLLMDKIIKHNCDVWLLNTGWSVDGNRIPLEYTRKIIEMISNDTINNYDFIHFPYLNVDIPMIKEISDKYLLPYNMWISKKIYFEHLVNILNEFNNLFIEKFGKELFQNLTN